MKAPHIHVEKTPMPGFGHAATRALIIEATGLVPDLPKTVGTGCGRRRPVAMTSTAPERITCLARWGYARAEYLRWADMAAAPFERTQAEPRVVGTLVTPPPGRALAKGPNSRALAPAL